MWQEHERASQRQRDSNKVDGENSEVDSTDKVRHTGKSDQLSLYVTRMLLVVQRG